MSKVPTLTLARLFEAQDQLIDAYVIYSHLNNHTPSDQLQQKITELEEAVFDKVANSYDQMISLLLPMQKNVNSASYLQKPTALIAAPGRILQRMHPTRSPLKKKKSRIN